MASLSSVVQRFANSRKPTVVAYSTGIMHIEMDLFEAEGEDKQSRSRSTKLRDLSRKRWQPVDQIFVAHRPRWLVAPCDGPVTSVAV